jgi:hypothetical protein
MSLSVVEGGSKIKLTSGWKEFKFFLVIQLSRATALVSSRILPLTKLLVEAKQLVGLI